jgi:CRP-like cAMP-binding protein
MNNKSFNKDLLTKDQRLNSLNLNKMDNYTILGEIGCLLNAPRSVTLRSGPKGAVIYCLSCSNSELAAAILDDTSFRMVLTHNVARYVKKTNESLFNERKILGKISDSIKKYQNAADSLLPEIENLLNINNYSGPPYDDMRKIVMDYKDYNQLSPIELEEFRPVTLVGLLEDQPSLNNLSFSEKSNVYNQADFSTMVFEKGEIICAQNDMSDAIFFLIEGAVEVIVFDQILDVIDKPGVFIGEISILLGYNKDTPLARTATLRAAQSTRLAVKKGSHFLKSIRHKPQVIDILFKTLTAKLKKSDSVLNDIFKKRRNLQALLNNFRGPKISLQRLCSLCEKSDELASEKTFIKLNELIKSSNPVSPEPGEK